VRDEKEVCSVVVEAAGTAKRAAADDWQTEVSKDTAIFSTGGTGREGEIVASFGGLDGVI